MHGRTSILRRIGPRRRVPVRDFVVAEFARIWTSQRFSKVWRLRLRDEDAALHASIGVPRRQKTSRRGLSLIEIVLALAILGGSMAVLGEAIRHAAENARVARDLTDAQLYCESKMAELQAGFLSTDAVTDMPIEPMADSMLESSAETTETGWLYSVSSELLSDDGLVSVYLSVYQDPNTVRKPVTFSMTRIILDETLMTMETEDML